MDELRVEAGRTTMVIEERKGRREDKEKRKESDVMEVKDYER